mgnify:CR=1 FL=1
MLGVFRAFGGDTREEAAAFALSLDVDLTLGETRGAAERLLENRKEGLERDFRRLADQLLLPFVLAGGGSFLTLPLTNHFETNQKVLEAFLPVTVYTTEETRSEVLVEIL